MAAKRDNSQSAAAYAQLRERIVSGAFGADQILTETELADQLAMSRTPVREAVKRLEDDGLLVRIPRKGVAITRLDQSSITELYAFREILECGAARLAARQADEAEIDNMRSILDETQALEDPVRANYEFHQAIYSASHNQFLIKSINNLIDSTALLGQSTLAHTGRPEKAYQEHLQLFNAIEQRDEELAVLCARKHIRQALLARLQQQRTAALTASGMARKTARRDHAQT